MAPTKAKARYAVRTPNPVAKGRKAIFKPPKGHVTACPKHQANNAFDAKKGSAAVTPLHLGGAQSLATWLKSREIKTLMSP
jgi:hypothetical protein